LDCALLTEDLGGLSNIAVRSAPSFPFPKKPIKRQKIDAKESEKQSQSLKNRMPNFPTSSTKEKSKHDAQGQLAENYPYN
jgi:hypothetical protein